MTGCHKKIVRVPVGFTHTHSSPFRNASAPVSVLCSKLEVNDVIKRKCADDARSTLLGAGSGARSLSGRCAEPFWVRDFSGLGTWSPALKIIAGDQALF